MPHRPLICGRSIAAYVASLATSRDFEPFRRPVDMAQVPDYLDVVQQPMDLGTIRGALCTLCHALLAVTCFACCGAPWHVVQCCSAPLVAPTVPLWPKCQDRHLFSCAGTAGICTGILAKSCVCYQASGCSPARL